MPSYYFYPYITLTGGADGAVDSLDGSLLKDNDGVFVIEKSSGHMRPYILDEDSAATESSPGVISPDSNAGDKRWVHATFDPAYIPVLQTGTGAVKRALSVLGIDIYSVTSWNPATNGTDTAQTAIAAAVLAAYTAGKDLYWPKGTYLTTANIPYLHSVRHWGPGVIKRGDNSFYVQPRASHTNTLYCTTAGVATNDGLSSNEPVTVTAAVAALGNYGPMLEGLWDISVAAGTYTERDIEFPLGLRARYPVLVYGPDVATPTAIFDGEESTDYGFRIRNGTAAIFQDLKFIDFDQNYAIAAIGQCILATINVHTSNCYQGVLSFFSRLYVGGGTYELATGNYAAIVSMYCTLHNIGADYVRATASHDVNGLGDGPNIFLTGTAEGYGLYISENATGHVDGAVIDNMQRGAYIRANSRANFSNCEFKNCVAAVECELNSNFLDGDGNDWNATGADANTQTWRLNTGSYEVGSHTTAITPAMVKKAIGADVTSATLTGSTDAAGHTFKQWADFFAGHEFANEGYLKVRMFGALSGTNNTKTLRVRLDSTTVMALVFPAASVGDFFCEMVMHNLGSSTQKAYGFGTCSDSSAEAITSDYAMTINTGAGVDLNIQGLLANASDQIVVEGIEVWRGEH